jgi:hypothetical protein
MNSKKYKKKFKIFNLLKIFNNFFFVISQTILLQPKKEFFFLKEIFNSNFKHIKFFSNYPKKFINKKDFYNKFLLKNNFSIFVIKNKTNIKNIINFYNYSKKNNINFILGFILFKKFFNITNFNFFKNFFFLGIKFFFFKFLIKLNNLFIIARVNNGD